ncbi:hypothetical protein [Bartonella rattimassiliensis]|nr:hypothetical protein [Bartonella rattimassiliensis]
MIRLFFAGKIIPQDLGGLTSLRQMAEAIITIGNELILEQYLNTNL